MAAVEDDPNIVPIAREEIVDRLTWAAKSRCGMTVEEVLRQHRSGKLDDPGALTDVLILLHLLPSDDPLLAGQSDERSREQLR
ncbi:hypothetical protein GCM10009716_32290 [Streptomyces sodiiphilus]|uniref:Uncharacterized protein n=1 Tax=Streptomyces sodiiphilus TaxID=226217 RepID=A0ABN2PJV3_9ACTN